MRTPDVDLNSTVAPELRLSALRAELKDADQDRNPEFPRRLHQFFETCADGEHRHALAVASGGEMLTYAELESRANRLAHLLHKCGAGPGRRAGILLNRSADTYAALLAVSKAGATFVPLDPSYPADRLAFMAADAGVALVLTTSDLAGSCPGMPCPVLSIDREAALLSTMPSTRPPSLCAGDALAYIIYTSGTTGRPKGVAVTHANICHFLSVCTPIYAIGRDDRVYQGMTVAFDFSIEEIWPTLISGATLVPGPADGRKFGPALAEFLVEQKITVLYCVPTLLSTLDRDVPSIRTLVVGGEPCPHELVERWSRPGRRILNTYGPTETTVTATWCELEPGRPVTIGRPMPGYRVYVVDGGLRPVPDGQTGEICIGGPGVAQGYLNRPELTATKFVPAAFESGQRIYRSGDLGRFTPQGEIEFLGRIDDQVKIRGYRIELAEIEAVLLDNPAVKSAIVAPFPANGPVQDLAAYVTLSAPSPVEAFRQHLAAELRRRLPIYMVPAYIEVLENIPTLVSGKADRRALPAPVLPRVALQTGSYAAPATPLEHEIAAAWQAVLGLERISVNSDFFLELGGHSLLVAQLLTRLRDQPKMAGLSFADVYANPTIRALAVYVEGQTSGATAVPAQAQLRYSDRRVWTAALVQLSLLYALLAALGAPFSLFILAHRGRSALLLTGLDFVLPLLVVLVSFLLPLILKWLLIGRFKPGEHELWGWYFCRWWIVRKALEFSPLRVLAGSPLMPIYARLLGVRLTGNCQIATAHLHLPDLIEIGEDVSIGYDAEIQPFVIEGGRLRMATIRIGSGSFIGTKAVVLAGAEIGMGARIAEQTLVASGQRIPAFETWVGSPAQCSNSPDSLLTEINSLGKAPEKLSVALWSAFVIFAVLLEALPLALAAPGMLLLAWVDQVRGFVAALATTPIAGLMFVLGTCLFVCGSKRVMPGVQPGIYPQYSWFGLRKWTLDQLMSLSLTVTNTLYATLYTLPWLRGMGARIGPRSEVSTVSHIDPELLTLGSETFVADIATVGAAIFHNGWVALVRTEVGSRTFLGNACVARGGRRVPDNCLIGVQSVAPHSGLQPGSSWLGSPPIFLPRRQPSQFFAERLTYKPPIHLIAYRLFVEFFRVVTPSSLLYALGITGTAGGFYLRAKAPAVAVIAMPGLYLATAVTLTLVVAALKWTIVGRYRPRVEPLWAPFVRHSELITGLYEGFTVPALAMLVTGTPLLAMVLRLFGVSMGKRVYCETTHITEFDLLRVGEDASIGRATSLQTHLFEDRVMKMSKVTIGPGTSIGPRSVVLYDSSLGDGATLDALSLAMKGESIPSATHWRGIPARPAGCVDSREALTKFGDNPWPNRPPSDDALLHPEDSSVWS